MTNGDFRAITACQKDDTMPAAISPAHQLYVHASKTAAKPMTVSPIRTAFTSTSGFLCAQRSTTVNSHAPKASKNPTPIQYSMSASRERAYAPRWAFVSDRTVKGDAILHCHKEVIA